MATVVQVPRDPRSEIIGLGLGGAVEELRKRRRAQKLMEVLNNLPPEATEQELVAQVAPFVDEPTDLVNVLLQGRIKRAQRKTPEEFAAEAAARERGEIAGAAAGIEGLRTQEQQAREAGNIARADRLRTQIQKRGGKTLAEEAEEAKVKKEAELKAVREHMDAILGAPDTTGGMTFFRGETEEPSGDMKRVVKALSNAAKLRAAGEFSAANSFLSEARFIIENSADIQFQKDLDKPVSPDLAQLLQVPVGTTLRDVQNATPMSVEEQKFIEGEARAIGARRVTGRELLGFIGEGRTMLTRLKDEMREDPTIVGVGGTLRAKGRTLQEIATDFGAGPLIDKARELLDSSQDPSQFEGLFDSSTLSVLDILENSVGMILARLRQDTGRLSVDVIRRSIADVKLTGLTGSEQVQDRIDFILDMLDLRERNIRRSLKLKGDELLPESATGFRGGGKFYRLNPETRRLELISE